MVDKGNDTSPVKKTELADENFTPFYPSAESYEAENQNIELQIKALKKVISKQLQDELLRLQYELNEREARIRTREIQLAREQAEVRQLKELYIKKLAELDEKPNPKIIAQEEAAYEETSSEVSNEQSVDGRTKLGGNNPSGRGGLIGSSNSPSIIINRNKYQGPSIVLDDGSNLIWDDKSKEYNLISANQGLKFTYFAVEASYLNDGYENPNYPNMYSQTIFRKQVWYERPLPGKETDRLELQYGGRVPKDELMRELNSRINCALLLPNGGIIENQPFQSAYKNWRYTYQTGTFFKNQAGDLYSILEINESDSKGNPPPFRTDANPKSKTYGQQIKTKKSERAKWSGKISGKKAKGKP